MDYKQVGSKLEVIVQPGTVEAYQKAVELDPNGPYVSKPSRDWKALQEISRARHQTKEKKS